MFKRKINQTPLDRTIQNLFLILWILYYVGCGGGGGGGDDDDGYTPSGTPPQISHVQSSVFSDQDAVYETGMMVRFDIEESSGDEDIVSGTIRITSDTTGYDSGINDLSFGSIFYHWDTAGLDPADDYNVSITLVDADGLKTTDNSLMVTLAPNPPDINQLVSQVDVSDRAICLPVRVKRTYLLDSGFNNSLGFGWTHTYMMHVLESGDGLVEVFNSDGSGSFFHPNGDGTYDPPRGDFRTLTKDSDGTFQIKEKNGTLYQFTATGQLGTIEDRNGNITTLKYNADGLLITITDPSSQGITFTYDTDNRLSTITDSSGKTISYGYDSNGDLTAFTDVDGAITQYAYDSEHNLNSITAPSGVQTFFTINEEGRLASVSNGNGVNSRTYEYSVPNDNQMTVTDALGNETVYTFDNHGSITAMTDTAGGTTYMVYDDNLNLTHFTDADGNQTTFSYDDRGNVLTTTDAQGNTTTTTYENLFNRITSLSDANGNTTSFTYDSYGNLIAKNYPNGNTESFTYDGSGNLISLTDANGNTTKFEYEASGHMTRKTYPNESSESFTYDTFGNLASKTDRMAHTITYDYDLAGRLITKTYPNGTSVVFDYDDAGKLLNAKDENGTINFEYDIRGRLIRVTNQDGDIVSYGYDNAHNRTHLTYPNGMVLEYSYDELNRLTRISESGQMVAEYSYDSLSRVVRRELQNGTYSTYDYDPSSRLLEMVNRKSTSEIISSFAYTYDNVGNRMTMTTLDGLTQYTYDNDYQLTDVIYPDGSTTSYDFDAAGNRLSEVIDGYRIDYTTNSLDQYTDVNGDTYIYDANGNLTSKTNAEGITEYTYDFENRLVQVDTVKETIIYAYDPFGRRISKTTTLGTTDYIHDCFRVIMEQDDSDTIEAIYIHGIGIDELLVMHRDGESYFYSQDGLGSVTDLTNFSGNIIESFTYDAYGIPSNESSVGNPYLFAGREYEFELSLYYYRFRYYNPRTGRFNTIDPIGFQSGLNFYTYVQNNPVNLVAPLGSLYKCSYAGLEFECNGSIKTLEIIAWLVTMPNQKISAYWYPYEQMNKINGCIYARVCDDHNDDSDDSGPPDQSGSNTSAGDPTFIHFFKREGFNKHSYRPTSNTKKLNANISIPIETSIVRGNVPIYGNAYGKEFKGYRVEYGIGKKPSEWFLIHASNEPQTKDITSEDLDDSSDLTIHGNLATWDTGLKNYVYLPSHPKDHPVDLKGTYTIRLVVTGKDGSTAEDRVTVDVANVIPNAWGGQTTSKDKRVVLTVPEQAVMDSFRLILIDTVSEEEVELPSNRQLVGSIYRVREAGELFTKTAALSMAYSKEHVEVTPIDQLGIFGYNPKTKKWEHIESKRDKQNNSLSASVRSLHAYYAIMASDLENEGPVEKAIVDEHPAVRQANVASGSGHTFIRNNFEDGLGEWSNRDHEVGATVALDNSATYDGTNTVKISNTHVGGNFAVNAIKTPFDAKVYPLVQFDYRVPLEVKTNFLVNVSGRWYDIGFTDDPKTFEGKRVNIAHIGDIQGVVADNQWHTARFNLYDMLRTKTGNTLVDEMIMADWDVSGYMKLTFGQNQKGATYYIDNFMIAKESLAGLQAESDVVLVDSFNQMNLINILGGKHAVFKDPQKGTVSISFSPKTSDVKGRALEIQYDVPAPDSYAGYSSSLQNLDLRGFQRLSFSVRGETKGLDCMVGIKDSAGKECKVQLSRHLSGGISNEWKTIDIPLVAFSTIKDWGHIDNISFGFENSISPKGRVYLDNISFHKSLPTLKIDDFENADQKNTIGNAHHTIVGGNAAINGKYTKGSPNGIFRISYGGNIGKINAYASDLKSFAGWQTNLGGVDCSQCQNLTMRVRGAEGGENFTVYLDDGNFRWGVNMDQRYEITTDWQTISIPLTEFSDYGLDLTHLNALQVIFEGHPMSGTVYLDDIALQSEKANILGD